MNLKFLIYSIYDAFLANRDAVCFTSNIRSVKKFASYSEAYAYGKRLEADLKITHWGILALPEYSINQFN